MTSLHFGWSCGLLLSGSKELYILHVRLREQKYVLYEEKKINRVGSKIVTRFFSWPEELW
jgi:hypothetical protein